MHGKQRETYDEVISFLREGEGELQRDLGRDLRAAAGSRGVRHSVSEGACCRRPRPRWRSVRRLIDAKLTEEREKALAQDTGARGEDQGACPSSASSMRRSRLRCLRSPSRRAPRIDAERFISAVRDRLGRYQYRKTIRRSSSWWLASRRQGPGGEDGTSRRSRRCATSPPRA